VRKIVPSRLTTSGVIRNGEAVRLDFLNQDGDAESIELSIRQAESIVMTLPQLLSTAIKQCTGDPQARFVFSVGEWSLEGIEEAPCLLVNLKTPDGFQTTFAVDFAQCRKLGSALIRHASRQGTGESAIADHEEPGARLN
jgi:hypothetical protein